MELTEKQMIARSKLCLPLDGLNTLDAVRARVEELRDVAGLFKIGKESFTRFGPEVVRLVHEYEAEVFLDLKFHDIPNTVKGAAAAAAQLGIFLFNVHASGGSAMMRAALEGARETSQNETFRMTKIIAVTVLTSIDQGTLHEELRVPGSVKAHVLHYAERAHQAGLHGIVCSAADLSAIKNYLPKDFLYVTPGIKGPFTDAGSDQKRVFTPGKAIQAGAGILVVGRAITAAEDRVQAAVDVLNDMAAVL